MPIHHNYIIQAFVYNLISSNLAKMLHDKGFEINNRKFKLFTFSRLQGNFKIDKRSNTIIFHPPFTLTISSALDQFIEELANEVLANKNLRIGKTTVKINSIEVPTAELSEKNKIKMLSPATIYSTLKKADGKKKTYYYSPFEKEFSELISQNAKKKIRAFRSGDQNGSEIIEPEAKIELTPLNVTTRNEKIINYKGTIIKGWTGIYELSGNRKLIKLVYDTGLGGKNSQGFGCFDVIN